jgi:hypothetical protein
MLVRFVALSRSVTLSAPPVADMARGCAERPVLALLRVKAGCLRFLPRKAVDRGADVAYAGRYDGLTFPRGTTMTKCLPLLACLLLAASSLYADEAEDKAVATVEELGGTVERDRMDPE